MVQLASKTVRDDAGIDTYERGLLWAALTLRATLEAASDTTYKNWVRITWNANRLLNNAASPLCTLQIKLPYAQQSALLHGGNWLEHIDVFGETTPPNPLFTCPPTDPNPEPIPTDPAYVTTLERYLAWCAHALHRRLVLASPPNVTSLTLAFFEEASPRNFAINALLPFDWAAYHESHSILCALLPLGTPGGGEPPQSSAIGNGSVLSNTFLIQN